MRAPLSLLLILALLAPLAPAGADEGKPFTGRASTCDVLRAIRVEVGPPCPYVRHEGRVEALACDATTCDVRFVAKGEGGGFPTLRKTLRVEMRLDHAVTVTACSTDAAEPFLACAGQASGTLALQDAQCAEVRVRTTLVELADVPPTLPVRTETSFTACREGNTLRLS